MCTCIDVCFSCWLIWFSMVMSTIIITIKSIYRPYFKGLRAWATVIKLVWSCWEFDQYVICAHKHTVCIRDIASFYPIRLALMWGVDVKWIQLTTVLPPPVKQDSPRQTVPPTHTCWCGRVRPGVSPLHTRHRKKYVSSCLKGDWWSLAMPPPQPFSLKMEPPYPPQGTLLLLI